MSDEFNPWKKLTDFDPTAFSDMSNELIQWPIKLWKAPVVSPYYHKAHLLIAADCSAFACPSFHDSYSRGKVMLICCPETDFDMMSKLSKILKYNDISSITVVKPAKDCCGDMMEYVKEAARSSRFPVPIQMSSIIIEAEDMEE